MAATQTITKAFSLEEIDIQVIKEKASEMGNSPDSAALRAILREWKSFTQSKNAKESHLGNAPEPDPLTA